MPDQRKYISTHRWLTFTLDLKRVPWMLWMSLGEAKSKCAQIAGVPLKPKVAEEITTLYLTKGVQATTAIEGNTLTEAQVRDRISKSLTLPASREYLGTEVDNVIEALAEISQRVFKDGDIEITIDRVLDANRVVLKGLEVEPPTIPGRVREHSVGVSNYLGAPPEDCEYLLAKLCDWLNEDWSSGSLDIVSAGILKAIIAHLYIAWIHPFGDGNGRTARLLEFLILTTSGVPSVAAHVLTNHYNLTRAEYYRQLDHASKSGGDLNPFLLYAVRGFADGLAEQLEVIRKQQLELAWRDHVHELLADSNGKVVQRQRHLVLSLPADRSVPISELSQRSAKVAADYANLSRHAMTRDIENLLQAELVIKDALGIRANLTKLSAFMPRLTSAGAQPPLMNMEP